MQDPQDNTFPIPGTDNNIAGGSVAQPAPTTGQPPIQPAQTAPLAGSTFTPAAEMQTPELPNAYPTTPAPQPTASPVLTGNPLESMSPPSAAPPQDVYTPPTTPAPIQPQPASQPAPITSNTLDLSNQPNYQQTNPQASPTDQPLPYTQPGDMQPGIPVQPEPQATSAAPYQDNSLGSIPVDFGVSNNAMANNLALQQSKKKSGPLKFIIIAVVVIAIVVIASLVALFYSRNANKTSVNLNNQTVDQNQQASTSTTTAPAVIPDGYQQVTRDCFSFGVLLPTTVDFQKTICKMGAKFGATSQYSLLVDPVTDATTDLQALVDKAKTTYNGTISTQSDIKLNGLDAKKVVMNVAGVDQQVIAVLTPGKNYQSSGTAVNGFLISTTYSDDASKKASDTLASTWTWK